MAHFKLIHLVALHTVLDLIKVYWGVKSMVSWRWKSPRGGPGAKPR